MSNEKKDLQSQLQGAHADIKAGQASGNTAQVDKGMAAQSQILKDNGIIYPAGNKGAGVDTSVTPLPKSWGGSGTVQNLGSGSPSRPSTTKGSSVASSTMASMLGNAKQMNTAAQNQQKAQIQHAVNQGVTELQRAEEDAQEQFETQQKQVDIDEAKALDNQALYAEARGDRGGIGQAQYNQIQNTAMNNRRAINSARTKLSTDTARQMADLRAQGEFQTADALLQLSQTYLAQLTDIQKWGAEFTMSEAQFNFQIEQWAEELAMKQAELTGSYNGQMTWAMKTDVAKAALAALEEGLPISESQMAALREVYRYDEDQVSALQAQYASARESEANVAVLKMAEAALDLGAALTPEQRNALLMAGWTEAMITAKQRQVAKKNSTSPGGDKPKDTGNVYQKLYDAGYRTEGEAYAALLAQGYTATEAANLRDYYLDWLDGKKERDAELAEQARIDNAKVGDKGKSYSYVWGEVRDMHDRGATMDEVTAFMAPYFSNGSLTEQGMDYILKQLGWLEE